MELNNIFDEIISDKPVQDESKDYTSPPITKIEETPLVEEKPKVEEVHEYIPTPEKPKNIDRLSCVPVKLVALLGKTELKISEVMDIGTGSVVNLNLKYNEPVELQISGKKIADGEVVVYNEKFAIKITKMGK